MDFETGFKIATVVAGFAIGWLMRLLWESQRDLQKADKELADKVQGIEVLVAGQYIKRDEFIQLSNAIFKKLDTISDKIDKKADKP